MSIPIYEIKVWTTNENLAYSLVGDIDHTTYGFRLKDNPSATAAHIIKLDTLDGLNSFNKEKIRYYAIVSPTYGPIGCCSEDVAKHSLKEDPGCHLSEISKKEFDEYGDNQKPLEDKFKQGKLKPI